jgi:hypothetical protein
MLVTTLQWSHKNQRDIGKRTTKRNECLARTGQWMTRHDHIGLWMMVRQDTVDRTSPTAITRVVAANRGISIITTRAVELHPPRLTTSEARSVAVVYDTYSVFV